jgi:nicotinate-nucleotide adenylyltransferase
MPNLNSQNKGQQAAFLGKDRKAILGGTFDPIHWGHIKLAQHIAQWLEVKKLTLLPAHIPPHKKNTFASSMQRRKMVSLVCQHMSLFESDEREIKCSSASYTIETLQQIKDENPQKQLFFIMGMDSLINFTTWHQWQDILSLCHLVVSSRPDYKMSSLNSEIKAFVSQHLTNNLDHIRHRQAGSIFINHDNNYPISSTDIRALLSQDKPIDNHLPDFISTFIRQQKLYR